MNTTAINAMCASTQLRRCVSKSPGRHCLLNWSRSFGWRGALIQIVTLALFFGRLASPASAFEGTVEQVELHLTPSSAQLAACMQNAQVDVQVSLTTELLGFDHFSIRARNLPPNRSFTIFLLEQATSPFGAAEYIGDFSTDANGNGDNTLGLIVQEAFSSTLVNGQRVRVDLNQVGVWFADPKDDDFCLGANSPVTPFDGDNEAGVQAFNSAHTNPLPAP